MIKAFLIITTFVTLTLFVQACKEITVSSEGDDDSGSQGGEQYDRCTPNSGDCRPGLQCVFFDSVNGYRCDTPAL